MLFDNAVELQSWAFREAFGFVEVPGVAVDDGSSPLFLRPGDVGSTLAAAGSTASRIRRRKDHLDEVALGIGRADLEAAGGDDVRLQVLLQDRRAKNSDLVDKIVKRARGEVEILEVGRIRPAFTRLRNNPLRLGCSISPAGLNYSGTLGCFVQDQQGRTGILSNNHVLANVNRVKMNTDIVQPGGGDGGLAPADVIARLANFVPIAFGGASNLVDCAYATVTDSGRTQNRDDLHDGNPPVAVATLANPRATRIASPLLQVQKTGRTTVHRTGVVAAVNLMNVVINMGAGLGTARFDYQFSVHASKTASTSFSAPGDSGSLIVDNQGVAVGLLFAGTNTGGTSNLGVTFANPIDTVLTQLGVMLL